MDIAELLKNFSKENYLNFLNENINPVDFEIYKIANTSWSVNDIPFETISYLLDSYSCLPERPDMAFTFIWKSINSCYVDIAREELISTGLTNERLTDSSGIKILIDKIENSKNLQINSTYKIIDLIKIYGELVPLKSCRFISNIILKGYVADQTPSIPKFLVGSAYTSFKKLHTDIHDKIISTYGKAFEEICTPILKDNKVDYQITDADKNIKIINALAIQIKEFLSGKEITIERDSIKYKLSINDKKLLEFLIFTLLYSIRNKSVHGNVSSRLISKYANNESLKNSIYIYFLAHFILSLALHERNKLELVHLEMNISNLELLKRLVV